jgi:hypothetical protein
LADKPQIPEIEIDLGGTFEFAKFEFAVASCDALGTGTAEVLIGAIERKEELKIYFKPKTWGHDTYTMKIGPGLRLPKILILHVHF